VKIHRSAEKVESAQTPRAATDASAKMALPSMVPHAAMSMSAHYLTEQMGLTCASMLYASMKLLDIDVTASQGLNVSLSSFVRM